MTIEENKKFFMSFKVFLSIAPENFDLLSRLFRYLITKWWSTGGSKGFCNQIKNTGRMASASRIHKVVLYCLSPNKRNIVGTKNTDSDEVSTR